MKIKLFAIVTLLLSSASIAATRVIDRESFSLNDGNTSARCNGYELSDRANKQDIADMLSDMSADVAITGCVNLTILH